MSYRIDLAGFVESNILPRGLCDHLKSAPLHDLTTNYTLPHIYDNRKEYIPKKKHPLDPKKIRLPARIASPLIPYPDLIRMYISSLSVIEDDKIHGHHQYQISQLNRLHSNISEIYNLKSKIILYDINSLMRLTRCSYSTRTVLINSSALEFAKRATCAELSITALERIPYNPSAQVTSPYLSFLISMQRMRVLLALKGDTEYRKEIELQDMTNDAIATIYTDGSYTYIKRSPNEIYILLVAGAHFRLYHSSCDYWFAGNITYLDYALTLSDTINNLEILSHDISYSWARTFFRLIIDLAEKSLDQNLTVNFMKSLEGFLLNLSDYDEKFAMNWTPILEAAYELWSYDKIISNKDYPFVIIPALLHDNHIAIPRESVFCKMIVTVMNMSRIQRQEVSALHKFVFYAEVDVGAGVKKFLKRVHNKRESDYESVRNLTRLAKRDFLLAYMKKHRNVPTFKEENRKTAAIRLSYSSGKTHQLKNHPLKWWDDIIIWNCMDNTLTDDALEFAKDKGALKTEITIGPGDSKKELLQVIQRENYKLKDLMADGKFQRQPRYIERTTQKAKPVNHNHPARLIEKEREQKVEARLFANGELSNKHALSVYTTKMKKILNYFDEQLMTPSDSKRKMQLHRAAQSLRITENYSMLLDIEGHNQSMQEENTYELLEFIGNIYGEIGWGSLSNYFGALLVYHYDEYLDDALISKGQYGGIEGWMNPAWTLHTLLMMKLMRFMTDIELNQLMVYSDDVNAIVRVEQATESGIHALFSKVMDHCYKFGMIAKFSQTTLSKHRATMLRQHYSDGERADSTLKRLMSVSGANNPMLVSEEIEVAGICSSAASALELSNHHQTCCYLKNYKLGILLARLPHMLFRYPQQHGSLSEIALPAKLSQLLYNIKDDTLMLSDESLPKLTQGIKNDLTKYINQHPQSMDSALNTLGVPDLFKTSLASEKFLDNPDKLLYLQLYDHFIQDFLFFIIYCPASIGGLGGILHIDMMLSGHSNGFSKSIHYIHQWIFKYSSNAIYFSEFLSNMLSNSVSNRDIKAQYEILTTQWPSEKMITTANTSITSAIKSMINTKSRNVNVRKLLDQSNKTDVIAKAIVEVFSSSYHPRIAQFYYENSSVHFLDLLVNKIETSSGLLLQVKNLSRLRKSLAERTLKNIRTSSSPRTNTYGKIASNTDMIQYLVHRRSLDFPTIKFIEAEEILYDDKLCQINDRHAICTIRKCVPTHYENGLTIYNDPKIGNEVLYKGEYLDHNRMIGNKEELLAAKVCSVTKWLLTKTIMRNRYEAAFDYYDCVLACNISLRTLTGHKFEDLMLYCPDETGGEILHRIPNMRFSTNTYIRSELNKSLGFTSELNQYSINERNMVDSNINFDYLRLRLTLAMMVKDDYDETTSVISRFDFSNLSGICDVQFVAPIALNYKVEVDVIPYSQFRNHKFSDLRFRFMAASYLTSEDISDLSLLPNTELIGDLKKFGEGIIGDIIYKYARALDKEYMTTYSIYPRDDIWEPIYPKLELLIKDFNQLSKRQKHEKIIEKLRNEFEQKLNLKFIKATDKAAAAVQSEILIKILEDHPNDQVYESLKNKYLIQSMRDNKDKNLEHRLHEYNKYLRTQGHYMDLLSKSLISEIIVTLYFKYKSNLGALMMDVVASVKEYEEIGLIITLLQELNPELYVRSMILGLTKLRDYYSSHRGSIMSYLYDISLDVISTDIELPELHLSSKQYTQLPNEWEMPESAYSINYHIEELSTNAMKSLSDINPMIKYIERTCNYAANPAVYASPTGSDSCQAQYALYKMIKREFGIDKNVRICDLTAGRGDGLYAFKANELNAISYSRPDIFTNVLHHPDIIFKDDYDVFKAESLDFCTNFDFVHIDISFTGKENPDLSDCILTLESLSIPYCVRLNSINLQTYSDLIDQQQIEYAHYIAHSMSDIWRTYQVYMIGIPGSHSKQLDVHNLRQSSAFRSMALSYSAMMKKSFVNQYSDSTGTNSVSICLPNQSSVTDMLSFLADKCIVDERNYYLDRFMTECLGEPTIYISREVSHPSILTELNHLRGSFVEIIEPVYTEYSIDDIGQVSIGSRTHHLMHLPILQSATSRKIKITLSRASVLLMTLLRRYHPLYDGRRLCNILLGITRMCPEIDEFNRDKINAARCVGNGTQKLIQTRSQKEIIEAIKLHIVSLSSNDESLPLRYCSIMGMEYKSKKMYYERIRKNVKLLSGQRPLLHQSILNGTIPVSAITTMGDELFIRKCLSYEQARKYSRAESQYLPDDDPDIRLDLNFDELFESLERFSVATTLAVVDPTAGDTEVDDPFSRLEETYKDMFSQDGVNLTLDIDVGQHINDAVDRLGLELDPITGIYKGFDISVPDDEELW